jgi:drug/metabolite transporter (DMT)-like permease
VIGAPVALPTGLAGWAGVALMGALQAAVYLLVYRGFGKGQLAVLNPLFASFSGITALLSIVLLGEAVRGTTGAALAVVFAGILLINLDVGGLRERRLALAKVPGFPEIAAATLLAAGWTLLWDRFVRGRDALASAALMYLFMTLALFAVAGVTRLKLPAPRPVAWLYLALIGGCEAAAYAAVSYGYATTPHTSVVALVSGAFSLPTILLARVFLRERTTRLQTLASLGIVAGIALLNAG